CESGGVSVGVTQAAEFSADGRFAAGAPVEARRGEPGAAWLGVSDSSPLQITDSALDFKLPGRRTTRRGPRGWALCLPRGPRRARPTRCAFDQGDGLKPGPP